MGIRRELAEARPDAFLPDLAESLDNQSVCLAGLGREKAALEAIEEAVRIRRRLPEATSGVTATVQRSPWTT